MTFQEQLIKKLKPLEQYMHVKVGNDFGTPTIESEFVPIFKHPETETFSEFLMEYNRHLGKTMLKHRNRSSLIPEGLDKASRLLGLILLHGDRNIRSIHSFDYMNKMMLHLRKQGKQSVDLTNEATVQQIQHAHLMTKLMFKSLQQDDLAYYDVIFIDKKDKNAQIWYVDYCLTQQLINDLNDAQRKYLHFFYGSENFGQRHEPFQDHENPYLYQIRMEIGGILPQDSMITTSNYQKLNDYLQALNERYGNLKINNYTRLCSQLMQYPGQVHDGFQIDHIANPYYIGKTPTF